MAEKKEEKRVTDFEADRSPETGYLKKFFGSLSAPPYLLNLCLLIFHETNGVLADIMALWLQKDE